MGITGTPWQQRNSVLCKTRIWPTFVFYKIQRQRHWQKTTQLSPKGNWKLGEFEVCLSIKILSFSCQQLTELGGLVISGH